MFIVTNNNNIVSYYVLNHELCTVLSSSHVIFIQSSKMDTVIVAVWWIKWSGGWRTYWRSYSSVHFSHLVMSNSLWLHGLQHARFPCLSPTPGVNSNSCPLSRWCHPTISSSVAPVSSCLQSFPSMSQFFASGGQSIGASASASVLPMNIQDWFPLGWTGLISLQSKELSRVFFNTTVQKHQFFGT